MRTIVKVRAKSLQVFSLAELSSIKERQWLRVDAHLVLPSMKYF
jgi:hypothetical protein